MYRSGRCFALSRTAPEAPSCRERIRRHQAGVSVTQQIRATNGEVQRTGAGSVRGLLADVSRAVWYASLRRGPGFETR
jgi:hypothetical protein